MESSIKEQLINISKKLSNLEEITGGRPTLWTLPSRKKKKFVSDDMTDNQDESAISNNNIN